MSHTIPLEEASADLPGLIRKLGPGDEVVLTDGDRTVARIVGSDDLSAMPKRRVPGAWKGMLTIVSDDDEHLEDFKDYMP